MKPLSKQNGEAGLTKMMMIAPQTTKLYQLAVDAICAPADTDISLANEAKGKSQQSIDILFKPFTGLRRKYSEPQCYKVLSQQLGFLYLNLQTKAKLAAQVPLSLLDRHQYCNLLVIHELWRQQFWMYGNHCHRISDRIVSIRQPHVRPIVLGKAGAATEFGAKRSASLVECFVFFDHLDWNSFKESGDLIGQIETFRQQFGYYLAKNIIYLNVWKF